MTVTRQDLLYRYIAADNKFNLGLVTVPVDPRYPDSTFSIRTDTVFGINKNSNHKQEAWEVIKVINGEELAKVRSQYMNELYSRTDYSKEIQGISLEPFYTLTRDERKFYNPDLSSKFQGPFYKMMSDELKKMLLNNQSVKNTIKNIQYKGKALLKVAEEMNNK